MDVNNFQAEVGLLLTKLVKQGYLIEPLLSKLTGYLKARPGLYGGFGWRGLYFGSVLQFDPTV